MTSKPRFEPGAFGCMDARMSWLSRFLVVLFGAVLLAGCATRGGNIPYNQADFGAPDPTLPAVNYADYALSPGDVVTVRVLELENLTGDQTVDGIGRIVLPLVGPVQADGRTTTQLQGDIAARLRKDYLQNPNVVVTLKSAVARTITLDGAVQQPGVYAIAPSSTLVQAVALARGLTGNANPKRAVIFRQRGGKRHAAAFDLTTIRSGKDSDPHVYPNDVIVVDGSALNDNYRTLLRSIPLIGLLTRF